MPGPLRLLPAGRADAAAHRPHDVLGLGPQPGLEDLRASPKLGGNSKSSEVELAGGSSAEQALPVLRSLAQQEVDHVVASNAVTVLAELGPMALGDQLARVLQLFQVTPDRASDLSEVALRVHAWGGACRDELCRSIVGVNHSGGHLLVEAGGLDRG